LFAYKAAERVRVKYDLVLESLDGKFRVKEDSSLRDDGSRADGARIRNRMATSFTVGTELSETNYRRALEVRGKSDIVSN